VSESPGDVLIVVKLDRLAGNTRDILNLVHEPEEKRGKPQGAGACHRYGGPMGRMVLTVLGMVAEMELGFIRDRQRAGIDAKGEGDLQGSPCHFRSRTHRVAAQRRNGRY
jgi:DNA invertase Pin-like site-specific DNA recombinase